MYPVVEGRCDKGTGKVSGSGDNSKAGGVSGSSTRDDHGVKCPHLRLVSLRLDEQTQGADPTVVTGVWSDEDGTRVGGGRIARKENDYTPCSPRVPRTGSIAQGGGMRVTVGTDGPRSTRPRVFGRGGSSTRTRSDGTRPSRNPPVPESSLCLPG